MLVAGSFTVRAQTAFGAMKTNGNFFVLRNVGSALQVREWDNGAGTWVQHGQYPGAAGFALGGVTPSGGFLFVESNGGASATLARWEPGVIPQYLGYPSGWPATLSGPSAVTYGNRVMVVGDGKLHERFLFGSTTWYTHGLAFGTKSIRQAPPCVLSDGSVFVVTTAGELAQMWWNGSNNTWNWYNHGYPKKFNWLGFGGVKAVSVGAAMPGSKKVFVTCGDGSLRQAYYNGSTWVWYNHGKPFSKSVDSPAVAVADGKLFVTASVNGVRDLLQLYWTGSSWAWYDHGHPTGTNTSIGGGALATIGGNNVAVQVASGDYCMLYWNGSAWVWKNVGS